MDDILEGLSAGGLLRAMERNRCLLWSLLRRLPGAAVYDGPDMFQVVTDDPFSVFNTIHRARLAPEEIDAAIEVVIARARARGLRVMWFVGPSTQPADLGASLEAHGFSYDGDVQGMAVDLSQLADAPLPPGFEITAVSDEEDLRAWCATMAAANQMPEAVAETYVQWFLALAPEDRESVHLYLGRLDGEVLATHLLMLGAGVAGIHYLATLPAARGKGIGSAICRNTLLEGRARGYKVGVTEAEPMAVGLCHKLGFADYYTSSTYIWSGQKASGVRGKGSWKKAVRSAVRRPGGRGSRSG